MIDKWTAHEIGIAAEWYRLSYERLVELVDRARHAGMPEAVIREATGPVQHDRETGWWLDL